MIVDPVNVIKADLSNERWSADEKRHFAFLHTFKRCALSGRSDGIQIAHIRIHTG